MSKFVLLQSQPVGPDWAICESSLQQISMHIIAQIFVQLLGVFWKRHFKQKLLWLLLGKIGILFLKEINEKSSKLES